LRAVWTIAGFRGDFHRFQAAMGGFSSVIGVTSGVSIESSAGDSSIVENETDFGLSVVF